MVGALLDQGALFSGSAVIGRPQSIGVDPRRGQAGGGTGKSSRLSLQGVWEGTGAAARRREASPL